MVNYVKVTKYRKTFQNKIFPELNSKKHTRHQPFNFYEIAELRKTLVAELRKTWVSQNAEKGNFARNDFCEWLRKLLFFRAKLMRNKRKNLRFVPQKLRKSFANGNPTHGETKKFTIYLRTTFLNKFWFLTIVPKA